MCEIHLSDRLGHVTSKKVGFSWWYLFLGPFYCFARLHILLGILEAIVLYYLLPIPGLNYVSDGIVSLAKSMVTELSPSFKTNLDNVLLFFRTGSNGYISLGFVVLIHIVVSNYIQGFFLRRDMKKKQLRPVQEADARLLIKYHVCNVDIALAESFDLRQSSSYKSAEESWYENNAKRIRGDRSTRFMTRSTILFPGDKQEFEKKKGPGTQTIEIEAWNDNAFGSFDPKNEQVAEKKDDEFSNFTDYSQFIPKDENAVEEEELLVTEPVTMELKQSDIDLGFFASDDSKKNNLSNTKDDLLF